jgi:serine/threonine protein kinase
VLALEYFHHEAKILYLDLDLENILLTNEGYIKLTDAALTKTFDYEAVKSLTFINEHGSLAPEIIEQSEEISEGADLWALGVLLYHLLEGKNPFCDVSGNKRKLYDNILNKKQEYIKLEDGNAISLIDSLLMKKTSQRFGFKSTNLLKQHSFFKQIDWLQLYN